MFKITKQRALILLSQIRSPIKLINDIGIRISYLLNLKRLAFLPSSLDIEPVNNCNFSCPHCQVTHWDKETSHLQKSAFEILLNQLPNLIWIKLQGMGEPLLNKELMPMLELGERKNIRMSFTTNSSLLKGQRAQQLARLKNTSITFSIDGASAKVFETIRVGSRFELVCKNISHFTNLIDAEYRSRIGAWMLLTKKNLHELKDVVSLVKSLGIGRLTLQLFINDWGKDEMEEYTNELKFSPSFISSQELSQTLDNAQQHAKDKGIELKVYKGDFYSKSNKCSWPWKSAYVSANGDVVPCCLLADSDTVKMGNIYQQKFSEIWNSPAYQELRKSHVDHNLPDYCRHCYVDD